MRRFSALTTLIAIAAWLAAEMTIFNLLAGWTGGVMAFLLFILKSVAGFAFVGQLIRRKLMSLTGIRIVSLDSTAATDASLKVIGAILLVIPGFLAGIVGLSFLNSSIRRLIIGRVARKMQDPRDIDLSDRDWREVPSGPTKRLRRRKYPRALRRLPTGVGQ